MVKSLVKGARITGARRGTIGKDYARRYESGESIRAIAESVGRSFGFVHGVLGEAGVTLRGRGGATRGAAREAALAAAGRNGSSGTKRSTAKHPAKKKPAESAAAASRPAD